MDKDKPTFSFDQLPSAVYELRGKVDALTQFITERFTSDARSGVATEEVMTIDKTAELLNVTVPTVRTMVGDRRIPFSKPANAKLYFLRSEIIQWIKDNRTPTTAEKAVQYETTRRGGRRAA